MKFVKTVVGTTLLSLSLAAMAQNALNDVRLSPQGVNLALVGKASLVVPNDQAKMIWTASAQAATLKEATAAAIAQMNKGIAAIKGVSLDAKLKTQHVNSYPVYSQVKNGETPKVIAWRVSQSLSLETDHVTHVPTYITAIDGGLELDNLTFSVSQKARENFEGELIRLAIADATRKAGMSAKAMGLKTNRVQLKDLVFEGADYTAGNRVLMRSAAKADYAAMPTPTIESGTTTLSLTVKANAIIR